MTNEEFAKLFPNVKWSQTFDGRFGTHIKPAEPPQPAAGYSRPSLAEDTPPPASMGLVRGRTPTSRERMFDLVNRALYGDGGIGSEGNRHTKRLTDFLDFTPIGTLHQAYDTGRAIGEGRFNDAAQSSGVAYLPALRKSPVNGLFNPKPKRQRHFSEDYPNGAEVNEDGELTTDIEGRPLQAPYIAGRVWPNEPDQALRPIDIQRIGEHSTRASIEKVPASRLGQGNFGETHLFLGLPWRIRVLDSLPKDKMDIAMAHEVGHAIDALSDQIPTKGLEDELDFNYSALRTNEERKFALSRPQDFGYKGEMVERERMAEAVRAYMVDPNYLKTVAPKTAARIRQFVADSPDLTNIIQFNGLAAGGALAGTAAGQSNNAEAGEDPANHRKDGLSNSAVSPAPLDMAGAHDFDQLTKALVRRGLAPQPSQSQRFKDLVRALLDREAQRKPPSRGAPR